MVNIKNTNSKKEVSNLFPNYVKLIGLLALTVFIVIFVRNSYHSYNESNLNVAIIKDALIHEVTTYEELTNFINENQTTVIYIGSASDIDCRNLEKKLVSILEKRKLQDDIIYVNLNKYTTSEVSEFFNKINSKYDYNSKISNYPVFIYFEDGKIKDVTGETDGSKLSISAIKDFLDDNEIVSIN